MRKLLSSDLKIAKDPKTSPAQLAALSFYKSSRVIAAVARHPNTPIETLRGLLPDHPSEVLSNPALPLHLLANPQALYPLEIRTIKALAQETTALGAVLGWRGDNPLRLTLDCVTALGNRVGWYPDVRGAHELAQIRVHAIQRGSLPSALLARLVDDQSDEVRAALAKVIKDRWMFDALMEHPTQHEALLMNARFPAIYLDALTEHPDPKVRRRVPEHAEVSAAQLIALARDADQGVRAAVARHAHLPEEAARWLRYDPELRVRDPLTQR